MANVDSSNFTVNSDFPMPAQVSQKIATINVPAGTQTYPTSHHYAEIEIGDGLMIRFAVKSSRNNMILPSLGQGLMQFEDDGFFSAYARCIGGGKVRCEVHVQDGIVLPSSHQTSSDNNFTFYISAFKLP